jgi:thiol:disulfide interchange protein DsbC
MNLSRFVIVSALSSLLAAPAVWADQKSIRDALKVALPGMEPDSIEPTNLKGLYEVMVGPKLFYISEDGSYLIQGSLIDIKARRDLTEPRLAEGRLNALKKVGAANMIVFKPKSTKYVAYVFTDIDCGYCRKLHSEIKQYLDAGIEIRYLFFPRAGENSESYKKAVAVWCAANRNDALTKAKKGESVPDKSCDNPVSQHMALGAALGASGTPMIVTDKGSILPGYVPAAQLSQLLTRENQV